MALKWHRLLRDEWPQLARRADEANAADGFDETEYAKSSKRQKKS